MFQWDIWSALSQGLMTFSTVLNKIKGDKTWKWKRFSIDSYKLSWRIITQGSMGGFHRHLPLIESSLRHLNVSAYVSVCRNWNAWTSLEGWLCFRLNNIRCMLFKTRLVNWSTRGLLVGTSQFTFFASTFPLGNGHALNRNLSAAIFSSEIVSAISWGGKNGKTISYLNRCCLFSGRADYSMNWTVWVRLLFSSCCGCFGARLIHKLSDPDW